MDDLLKKEKYRCNIGATTPNLEISDLFLKLNNGVIKKMVKLLNGMYVPTESLDFEDVKKSRLTGSLHRCIKAGLIVVENPAFVEVTIEPEPRLTEYTPITEVAAGVINPADITNKISEIISATKGASPFPEERPDKVKEVISFEQSRTTNSFAISEEQLMNDAYSQFKNAKYFQKLRIVRETTDMTLLNDIIVKSEYPQLIHNASLRLEELKKK